MPLISWFIILAFFVVQAWFLSPMFKGHGTSLFHGFTTIRSHLLEMCSKLLCRIYLQHFNLKSVWSPSPGVENVLPSLIRIQDSSEENINKNVVMSEDFLQHCKQLHQLPECYIVILTEFRDYTGTNFAATTGNFKLSLDWCAILICSIQGELYTEQGLMDAPSLFPSFPLSRANERTSISYYPQGWNWRRGIFWQMANLAGLVTW